MAETETNALPPTQETASGGGDAHATIALSEENLLALLSSSAPAPAAPKVSPSAPSVTSANASPAPAEAAAEHVKSAVPSPQASPAAAPPVRTVPAATPVATPNRAVPERRTPPHPSSEGVDSTLALLAAIKENRAGILRSEANPKTASQLAPAESASAASPAKESATPEPPAKVQQSKLPDPVPAPARIAASGVAPTPISVSERIDRHPAMPISRNAPAAPGPPLRSALPRDIAPVKVPLPSPIAGAMERIPGGRLTLLIAGGIIAVGGVATGLILRSHRTPAPHAAAAPVTAAPANNYPLQLQIEPQGKQINVHWNPQSTLISQSREGRLVITENNQKPRTVELALDQLKFGHLTYQPQTDRVEFRLEVVDASGSVAEESILSLANPPAPGSPAPVNAGATPQPVPAPTPTPKNEAPVAPSVAESPKQSRTPARAFTPPTVNRKTAEGGIVDAPPELNATVTAPIALPSGQVPRAAAPPPPSPAPTPRALLVESNLQAAKLTTKVTPVYPPLAKSARVQGTVHFKATIGKDGSVRNLEMIGGPAILRQPAMDAVKQWKYQPTVLNGLPMEVVTSIDVNFTLGQ